MRHIECRHEVSPRVRVWKALHIDGHVSKLCPLCVLDNHYNKSIWGYKQELREVVNCNLRIRFQK